MRKRNRDAFKLDWTLNAPWLEQFTGKTYISVYLWAMNARSFGSTVKIKVLAVIVGLIQQEVNYITPYGMRAMTLQTSMGYS